MAEDFFNIMTEKRLLTSGLVMENQAYVPTVLRPSTRTSRAGGPPHTSKQATQLGRLSTRLGPEEDPNDGR